VDGSAIGNESFEGVLGASIDTFDLEENCLAGQGDFSGEITFQKLVGPAWNKSNRGKFFYFRIVLSRQLRVIQRMLA
jgi:hypothetical protein